MPTTVSLQSTTLATLPSATGASFYLDAGGACHVPVEWLASGLGTVGSPGVFNAVGLANGLPVQPGTSTIWSTTAKAQTTSSVTLQSAATGDVNGSVATTDGYNGAQQLLISNGAGTCTVNVEGSFDNFATAQDIMPVGVVFLGSETGGVGTVNVSRAVVTNAISVAANTSVTYALQDIYPYIRARISAAAGLGAGSSVTGCTAKLYSVPQ